ncbi:RNA-binding protein 7 [Opisthocomus hoazin]|uniref:RNA-binding protein 7 n=1 Tax=Opisthocomus hoazin TaxID=30419 RepID=UPI003F53BA5D
MGAAAAEADRTLFVGNLDPRVTEELVFELFHQAGPVIKVKIPKDRDGRPKQFAFVNFKHEESVPYGLSLLNGIKLYGRPIKIQFRAGSSHASQDGSPACSPHGPAGASTSIAPHPASRGSRYDRSPDGVAAAGFSPVQRSLSSGDSLHRQAVMWQQPQFGGKHEPPGYQHAPHAFHPSPASPLPPRRPEVPLPRRGRPGAHPYPPESRHLGREPRFGEHSWGPREEYGGEERGHDAKPHYWAGREEPAYDDRHRDSWSHDHDYRWEGYREPRWHPARH